MPYTPTNWKSGDVVTAARLNNLEQGIGGINVGYTPHTWADGDTLTAARMNAMENAVAAVSTGINFVPAQITLECTGGLGYNEYYHIAYVDAGVNWDYVTAFRIDNENGISTFQENDEIYVEYGSPVVINVNILEGNAITIWATNSEINDHVVTGNATVTSVEDSGYTFYAIIATGDCTISVEGNESTTIYN